MLFLVRFPSQRSGTPYYPNLDSIATCPPLPPSPSSAQLNSPSPPGSDVILQEGVRLVSFCLCACMRWLAGRLAVGDKRTLLLRPVAQPRQSLYYIHRGWSAVNRDERGKRSDNCWFFFRSTDDTCRVVFRSYRPRARSRSFVVGSLSRTPDAGRVDLPHKGHSASALGLVMFDFDSFRRGSTCAPRYDACRHLYLPHRWTTRGCVRSWLYSGLCLPSHMVGSSLPKKTKKVSRTVVL